MRLDNFKLSYGSHLYQDADKNQTKHYHVELTNESIDLTVMESIETPDGFTPSFTTALGLVEKCYNQLHRIAISTKPIPETEHYSFVSEELGHWTYGGPKDWGYDFDKEKWFLIKSIFPDENHKVIIYENN